MAKKFLRTEIGERVEQRDFQHAARASQQDITTQLVNTVMVGEDSATSNQPKHYVLKGFALSTVGASPPSTTIRVDRGTAIMGYREQGTVVTGAIVSGGDDFLTRDIASYADGTYGIYVKFDLRDADFENRLFWNASASTPVETTQSIATRYEENWAMVVETASPGSEWMKLGEVAKTGTTLVLTDQRDFFFEGRVDQSYDPTQEWGAANDRNADRATHGIFGMRRFVRAVQKQLAAVSGGNWWDTISVSVGSFLQRDGSNTVTGIITPDGSGTRDWGSAALRYLTGYFTNLNASGTVAAATGISNSTSGDIANNGTGDITAASGDLRASLGTVEGKTVLPGLSWLSSAADCLTPRHEIRHAEGFGRTLAKLFIGDSATSGTAVRVYGTGTGAGASAFGIIEVAVNCYWDQSIAKWTLQTSGGNPAYKIDLATDSIAVWRHIVALGSTWNNQEAGNDWTKMIKLDMPAGNLAIYNDLVSTLGGFTGADFNWTAAQTELVHLPLGTMMTANASDFIFNPTGLTDTLQINWAPGSAQTDHWAAQVPSRLPNGGTLVNVKVLSNITIDANLTSATVDVRRLPLAGGAGVSLFSGGTQALTVDSTDNAETFAFDQNQTIDMGTYFYRVVLAMTSSAAGTFNMYLKAPLALTYTATAVRP